MTTDTGIFATLSADVERIYRPLDKHLAQCRRELDVLFAADLDELIRDVGPETMECPPFPDAADTPGDDEPDELPPHPTRQLTPAALDREYALNNMVARAQRQDAIRRAAEQGTATGQYVAPALRPRGPRNPVARRVDGLFARVEMRWRAKQAQRDQRMGVEE